ncbi:MAG: helix-turn-helix domain-containing protein [Terriglobales bacterium]
MIKNERQYRITNAQAARFRQAIAGMKSGSDQNVPLALRKAQIAALRSQLHDLQAELREYETLKSGRRAIPVRPSFEDLPQTLIRARIASGLTQQGLARRLGLKAQQIQRYEATEYRSASLGRLQEVAQAVGLAGQESAPASRRPPHRVSRARKGAHKSTAD